MVGSARTCLLRNCGHVGIQLQLSNLNSLLLDSCNRTVSLRARQSSELNWVLFILVSPLLATRDIRDVLITSEKEDFHV